MKIRRRISIIDLAYEFDWSIPFREPYYEMMITGIKVTLILLAATTIASLCLGTVIAVFRISGRSRSFLKMGSAMTRRNYLLPSVERLASGDSNRIVILQSVDFRRINASNVS